MQPARRFPSIRVALAVLGCMALCAAAGEWQEVAPGVEHRAYTLDGPLAVYATRIDLTTPGLRFMAVPGKDDLVHRERPSDAVQRFSQEGCEVPVATNADFGNRKGKAIRMSPAGMFAAEGELLASPTSKSSIHISKDNRPRIAHFVQEMNLESELGTIPIAWLNHWYEFEHAALFTSEFGASEAWEDTEVTDVILKPATPAIRPKGRVEVEIESITSGRGATPIPQGRWCLQVHADSPEEALLRAHPEGWTFTSTLTPEVEDFCTVVSGAPQIAKDGKVHIRQEAENLHDAFVKRRHPRTGIGYTKDAKTLIMVVVDGRQAGYSIGVDLADMAQIMIDNGAWDALNLDGGGSSCMVVNGEVVNKPSDPDGERAVTSSLLVLFEQDKP